MTDVTPTERTTTELAIDAIRAQALWDLAEHLEQGDASRVERFLVRAGAPAYLRSVAAATHPYFAREAARRSGSTL